MRNCMGRLRFELRTSRLKAGCSTAELATRALWGMPFQALMDLITQLPWRLGAVTSLR